MKKSKQFILIILAATLSQWFCVSCKKNEMPHYTLFGEILNYANFQKGSYWIYYNNQTQLTDSTYITDHEFETKTSINPSEYQYDQITINFASKVYSKFEISASDDEGFLAVYTADSSAGVLATGMFTGSPIYQNWDVAFYPTYLVNGIPYSTVYHSKADLLSISRGQISTDCYYAKNVGIIRLITTTNLDTTFYWSLIRYKTIQ